MYHYNNTTNYLLLLLLYAIKEHLLLLRIYEIKPMHFAYYFFCFLLFFKHILLIRIKLMILINVYKYPCGISLDIHGKNYKKQ